MERDQKLYTLMLAELRRKPWPKPPAIPEPTDEQKVAFARAFVSASKPRIAPVPAELGLPLHLKYRPKQLRDVIGQDVVVASLERLFKDGLPHAFLFTGPSGVGKTTLARVLAHHLGTTQDGLVEIDAATHSGIDSMRVVLSTLQYRALGQSPNKMVIVDECHALSKATWQSLLLAIEEPHSHVYWALCTTEGHKVPNTIVTRCHAYQLKSVNPALLADHIQEVAFEEDFDVSESIIQLCAKEAGGSVRQALVNLSMARGAANRKEAARLLAAASSASEIIELARMLVDGSATWDRCLACINALPEGDSAEGVRMVVLRYVQTALLGTKEGKKVFKLLAILEQFSTPFFQAEDKAPLLLAVGRLMFQE